MKSDTVTIFTLLFLVILLSVFISASIAPVIPHFISWKAGVIVISAYLLIGIASLFWRRMRLTFAQGSDNPSTWITLVFFWAFLPINLVSLLLFSRLPWADKDSFNRDLDEIRRNWKKSGRR